MKRVRGSPAIGLACILLPSGVNRENLLATCLISLDVGFLPEEDNPVNASFDTLVSTTGLPSCNALSIPHCIASCCGLRTLGLKFFHSSICACAAEALISATASCFIRLSISVVVGEGV